MRKFYLPTSTESFDAVRCPAYYCDYYSDFFFNIDDTVRP